MPAASVNSRTGSSRRRRRARCRHSSALNVQEIIMTIRCSHPAAAGLAAAAILSLAIGLSAQSGMQRAIQQSRDLALEFEVTQASSCVNPPSLDQITIVFSNQ